MWRSVPQMPAARTARRTCPGPGRGWGSSLRATFPSPRAVFTTPCMILTLRPPSYRVHWRMLPHVEGGGIILQKAHQDIALLAERGGRALRQRGKGGDGERGRLFLALHAPGPRDPSIHEERGWDTAIFCPQ